MATDSYFYQYLFLGVFVLFTLFFPLLLTSFAHFVAPKKPSPIKNSSYECGLEAEGESWIQFRIQYYIYALLFVIFDVETIFIYPWAVAFKQLGFFALIEMALFIGILSIGLVYAWRKRLLEWD
jgi:NADH:ubiquinone oxidoreductase subunit 3 (subunit A)